MKRKINKFIQFLLLSILVIALFFTTKYSLKYMHWKTKSYGYPGLYKIENEYKFSPIDKSFLANSQWQELLNDVKNDGDIPNWPDAKSLAVYRSQDTIWLKYSLHNSLDINEPMVTMAVEDKKSGDNWYGSVKDFKYKEIISVGYVRKGNKYYGYNFIGDKKGVCDLYYSLDDNCLLLALPTKEILKLIDRRFIASVGQKGLWNDDFDEILDINQLLLKF